MRLFVALRVPDDVRANLAGVMGDFQRADRALKWIRPEQLHITLKFIGGLSAEKLPAVRLALGTVSCANRVELAFRRIGFFPNARRPTVVWLGIEATPNLAWLAIEVNRVLKPLGIAPEEKPFVPHLTIARLKETRIGPALICEIEKYKLRSFGESEAGEFELVESKLKTEGAEHVTLYSFPFVKQDADGNRS